MGRLVTTTASRNTAVTSHQLSWRPPTTLNNRDQPPAELSDQKVSGLTGMLHWRSLKMSVTVGKLWAICGNAKPYHRV
jgi:hypothetical protein